MSGTASASSEARDKLIEQVQNDLKNLSLESKKSKSLQSLREATEEAIVKARSAANKANVAHDPNLYLMTNQILYPLVQGCESRDLKVVKLSLGLMQRLIVGQTVDFKGAKYITDTLWMLMESGIEEVKILQTVTLLLTSNQVAQHETLAKCLVICFRLNFTKDPNLNTIAGATVRQLVPIIFERVVLDPEDPKAQGRFVQEQPSPTFATLISTMLPKDTDAFVVDAYLLFQDIVLLVGAEQPVWMTGIMEMTRSFGLELLESILKKFPQVFTRHPPFTVLLKEKVCSLVIKLFSPNIKYRPSQAQGGQPQGGQDKPFYPITCKLLRVVSVLVLEYHHILTTETEIFLSLLLKFLDPDKPLWQNCMALEVVHKLVVKPVLLKFIVTTFDQKDHSTKVFQDMINGLGAFVHNVMNSPATETSEGAGAGEKGVGNAANAGNSNSGTISAGNTVYGSPGITPQSGFYYRNTWKPLTISFVGGQTKELFLDMSSDRSEVPTVSDGYGISLAYTCLLDAVRSMALIIQNVSEVKDEEERSCWRQLIDSSWCGILAALSLLLDASTDDSSTENILKAMENYASFCGHLEVLKPRDAYLASICKASLPPHYTLNVLKATPTTQNVSGPAKEGVYDPAVHSSSDGDIRHQVIAVGKIENVVLNMF